MGDPPYICSEQGTASVINRPPAALERLGRIGWLRALHADIGLYLSSNNRLQGEGHGLQVLIINPVTL